MQVEVDRLASLKAAHKINANSNEFAPSVEEADAILAKFGYVRTSQLAAA